MSSSSRTPKFGSDGCGGLAVALLLLGTGCSLGLDSIVYDEDTGGRGIPFGGELEISDTGITGSDSGEDDGSASDEGSDSGGDSSGSDSGGDSSGSDSGGDSSGSDSGGDSSGSDSGGDSSGGDSGGSGGSGGSTASNPILSAMGATDLGGLVEVDFVVADADGDLSGGYFLLEVDGAPLHYDIPGDLDAFSDGGTSTASFDPGIDACDSSTLSLIGQAEDASGLWSSSRSTLVTATGEGSSVAELGDDSSRANNLGSLSGTSIFCGDLYSVVFQYGGDEDWMYFTAGSSGSWTIELEWTASSSDYDIYLFDGTTGLLMDSAITESFTPREVITHTLSSGQTYYLAITAWEGSPGDYTLQIR